VEKINFENMTKILKPAYRSGMEFGKSERAPKPAGKAMAQ
jgi:hypothetical protein